MYQKLHNIPLLKGTKQNNKAHQQIRKNKTSFQLLKDYMHSKVVRVQTDQSLLL